MCRLSLCSLLAASFALMVGGAASAAHAVAQIYVGSHRVAWLDRYPANSTFPRSWQVSTPVVGPDYLDPEGFLGERHDGVLMADTHMQNIGYARKHSGLGT
jgi:hypothetical protein